MLEQLLDPTGEGLGLRLTRSPTTNDRTLLVRTSGTSRPSESTSGRLGFIRFEAKRLSVAEFDLAPPETLVAAGVDFVLIGGRRGGHTVSAYRTFDVDVAYSRDLKNLERLAGPSSASSARLFVAHLPAPLLSTSNHVLEGRAGTSLSTSRLASRLPSRTPREHRRYSSPVLRRRVGLRGRVDRGAARWSCVPLDRHRIAR